VSSQNDDLERIQRIRDRQLRARDPQASRRKSQRLAATRYTRTKVTFREVMREIPGKWRGMIIGGVVGFTLALILDRVLHIKLPKFDAFWASYLWYSLILFGVIVGRVLAMAMDWSEEDYDKLVLRK
jgi:hypothetical protein